MASCELYNHTLTEKHAHFTEEKMRLKEMQVDSQAESQTQDCLVPEALIQYEMNLCRALWLKTGFHIRLT